MSIIAEHVSEGQDQSGCRGSFAEPTPDDRGGDASDLDLMGSYYAEQQLDDDYCRNVIAPLRDCPAVSAAKVENVRTREFSFLTGSVVRTDRTRLTVILRGGLAKLSGEGDDLAEATADVMRKVAAIAAAAGERVVARG